jgi:hypothetical protein
VRVSFQPAHTLQQEIPKPKDKLDSNRRRDIVYKIECSVCEFTYYGQTNRALKTRIKEHKRAVEYNDIRIPRLPNTLSNMTILV